MVKDLGDLLVKEEPYETQVGHSDRSKTPVEPYLSDQWFVKMAPLAEPALEVVRDGTIKFFPERHAQQFLSWLGEKRDWPISRQLWWGHRIPVWRLPDTAPVPLDNQCWDRLAFLRMWIDEGRIAIGGGLFEFIENGIRTPTKNEPNGSELFICIKSANDVEIVNALEVLSALSKTPTFSTPGSAALSGRTAPWGGRTSRRIWLAGIPPRCS